VSNTPTRHTTITLETVDTVVSSTNNVPNGVHSLPPTDEKYAVMPFSISFDGSMCTKKNESMRDSRIEYIEITRSTHEDSDTEVWL
jgi:hypothetical protein